LIGVGLSDLVRADESDLTDDLLDPEASTRAKAERATDSIRAKFGNDAIVKGRSLR
jgi:DNA polymerase-4